MYVDDVGMGIGNMLLHLGAVFDGTGSFAQIRGNVVAQNFLGQTQIVAVDPGLVYLRQERGVFLLMQGGMSSAPSPTSSVICGLGFVTLTPLCPGTDKSKSALRPILLHGTCVNVCCNLVSYSNVLP